MRPADEGDDRVPARGLIQKDLGVACGDDLTAPLGRRVGDHPVDLPLAQDLQMPVGLIQQQHGTGVALHVGKDEEGLLEPAPA